MNPRDYKNIIFDFGGVIINIDPMLTVKEFQKLVPKLSESEAIKVIKDPLFSDFEIGHISEKDLRSGVFAILGLDPGTISDQEFDNAWNGMILDLPKNRLDLIESLAQNHRIFLLSNTNSIHMRCVSQVVQRTIQRSSIDHYFEKAYYSHQMGLRKPDRLIYDKVLSDSKLVPSDTLFLDDSPVNFSGACEAGISTLEVDRDILEIFA